MLPADKLFFKNERTELFVSTAFFSLLFVAMAVFGKNIPLWLRITGPLFLISYKLMRNFELLFARSLVLTDEKLVLQIGPLRLTPDRDRAYFAVRDKSIVRGRAPVGYYALIICINSRNPLARLLCNSVILQYQNREYPLVALVAKMEEMAEAYDMRYVRFQRDFYDWTP